MLSFSLSQSPQESLIIWVHKTITYIDMWHIPIWLKTSPIIFFRAIVRIRFEWFESRKHASSIRIQFVIRGLRRFENLLFKFLCHNYNYMHIACKFSVAMEWIKLQIWPSNSLSRTLTVSKSVCIRRACKACIVITFCFLNK